MRSSGGGDWSAPPGSDCGEITSGGLPLARCNMGLGVIAFGATSCRPERSCWWRPPSYRSGSNREAFLNRSQCVRPQAETRHQPAETRRIAIRFWAAFQAASEEF